MEQGHQYRPAHPVNQSNPLGLTGFILSLLGLVTCGVFSPFGLVFSFVGMFREPRGFAIAGLVLGMVGLLGIVVGVVGIVAFGVAAVVAVVAVGLGVFGVGHAFETSIDAYQIREAIVAYEDEHGALPSALADLTAISENALEDFFGNAYVVEIDPEKRTMTLTSHGRDGQPGTADDFTVTFDIPRP